MEEFSGLPFMYQMENIQMPRRKVIRNQLSMEQRIEVLKRFTTMQDIGQLARDYQCGRRQIKNILRKREKYITMWSQMKHLSGEGSDKPEDSSSALYDAVGLVLHEWVERARSYQINITDEILMNFGQEIANTINFKQFKPSNEWLTGFKQKYNLSDWNLYVKEENLLSQHERKPLSISIIIADLRREHGELSIPMGYNNDPWLMDSEVISPAENNYTNIPTTSPSDSNDSAICMSEDKMNLEVDSSSTGVELAKKVESYREALNHLGPLEQFALLKEDIRAVGLINQLENLFREKMSKEGI